MATLLLQGASGAAIDGAVAAIAAGPPLTPNFTPNAYFVSYTFGSTSVNVNGNGDLAFDGNGKLIAGTITGIQEYSTGPGSFSLSSLQLSFAAFAALNGSADAAQSLLSGSDAVTLSNNTDTFNTGAGDDTITIAPGAATVSVDGGAGSNTLLAAALRSDSTVATRLSGGSVRPGGFLVTAGGPAYPTPVQVSALDLSQVRFVDGAVYDDASTTGGQTAVLFSALLGRPSDAASLGAFAEAGARYGIIAIAQAIVGSPEGQAKTAGLSNASFVSQLYQTTLGRPADTAGQAFWTGALDNGTADRGTVAAGIVISAESAAHSTTTLGAAPVFGAAPEAVAADRIYQTLTGNLPSAALLTSAIQSLSGGATTAQFADGVIATPNYIAQIGSPDAATFVTGLELNVYGGTSATATSFWANGINGGGVTRGQVADAFASSATAVAKGNLLATQSGVAHA